MNPKGSAPTPRENSRKRLLAVRVNISLPSVLVTQAPALLANHGFLGLSDYVQSCLRRDLGMDFMRTR
jgi:hypothetical protein